MRLIPAIKKDEELVAEMDSLLSDDNHFHLWWLGPKWVFTAMEKEKSID